MPMTYLPHGQAIFNGGTHTQVNNNGPGNYTWQVNNLSQKSPWDILQAAVAPFAFHNSDDDNASRCHPNTRVAIINELRDFALRRGDTGHAKVVWLNGGVGAGKSAIARSLCEGLSATDSLLASFFFKRTDPSRNSHTSFVATITYQVYGIVPPQYQSLILGVIEHDPLVFNRSVDAQFQALIVAPLRDLFEDGYFNTTGRRLIVVDGLDECSTARAQINILSVIHKACKQAGLPFVFLIASRPENDIQAFFRSSSIIPLLHQLDLNDDSYLPDADIERFLREKLQDTCQVHQFKDAIPRKWPSNDSIRTLVRKSSGQFIYASVVVKYVTSNRHHPHKRLDVILELCPPKGDLPFVELDALYHHIFSRVEDVNLVLSIIGCTISRAQADPTIEDFAHIEGLDLDDCLTALCDLWSILRIEKRGEKTYVQILHKSLLDYLCNISRSGEYHIDMVRVLSKRAAKCLQYIQDVRYTGTRQSDTLDHLLVSFNRHMPRLINNIQLSHEDLMSFSLVKWYNTISSPKTRSETEKAELFVVLFRCFFMIYLEWLNTLVQTDYAYVYDYYLDEFQQLTNRHPVVYQWPSLTDSNFYANNVTALATVRILSTNPLMGSGPVTRLAVKAGFGASEAIQYINLLHDAILKCLKHLEHDVDHRSIATMLTYLTWALPSAAHSYELDAACNPPEPFAYAATGDHALSDLVQKVATAMWGYRHKHHTLAR